MKSKGRDSYQEFKDLRFLEGYSPAQILMNSKNYNITVGEIVSRNRNGNKNISILADLLLQMNNIYERSFSIRGARNYTELDGQELEQYNLLLARARRIKASARNSVYDLLIKEGRVQYSDVYDRLCGKIKNLESKIKRQGSSPVDDCNLYNYRVLQRDYEASYHNSANKLFG